MALAGHNSIVAPTGQEEVQYEVLTSPQFGLTDMQVRNWTNGPAFLTWSRGQNSHGNGIGGPLPRSFMKGQAQLQKQIMARYRELGILGHLPAFGGYAPWALAVKNNQTRPGSGATRGKRGHDYDTAWIDGRDPLFTRVADAWMSAIIAQFGSDHAWQVDAYFANGTGWGSETQEEEAASNLKSQTDLPPDPVFLARARAAYGAIERADGPTARWIYQSWALRESDSGMDCKAAPCPTELSRLRGFSSAAPAGNFILLDMTHNSVGMWQDPWQGSWGLPFIWTALPDYGGDQGIKGNMSEIQGIPFDAPPLAPVPEHMRKTFNPATQAVGVGYTPEGLDQNPAFYELLQEAAFKAAPEPDVTAWLVRRAHRRYGLNGGDVDVTQAWTDLAASGYANDAPVDDTTNVGKVLPQATLPAWMGFETGGGTRPKPALCKEWSAWSSMISAAARVPRPLPQTFTYDLVDVGREVLSQLTIPLSRNFSSALGLLHRTTQGARLARMAPCQDDNTLQAWNFTSNGTGQHPPPGSLTLRGSVENEQTCVTNPTTEGAPVRLQPCDEDVDSTGHVLKTQHWAVSGSEIVGGGEDGCLNIRENLEKVKGEELGDIHVVRRQRSF
jgi:alpha-N-acetylglucosaminidase